MAAPRRRKIVSRRRVDDEGEEDFDIDDDSLTEGSLASDDHDLADDSDTSNIDETSPTSQAARKSHTRAANGHAKKARVAKTNGNSASQPTANTNKIGQTTASDTEFMLNGLSIADKTEAEPVPAMSFEDGGELQSQPKSAPVVVSSSSAAMDQPQDAPQDRRRREHDEYRRKRDEDPAFVPNRGAFFMHDHRHAGPSANGFRPFGRGARGRGRGIGGPFAPASDRQLYTPADPIVSNPWAHDMHETVAEPVRHGRQFIQAGQVPAAELPPNGDGYIPTCDISATPINRTLSTEKHIGNVQVRVYIPSTSLKQPIIFSAIPVRQYTKLPDHRPPMRRDKPVRISLPNLPPRYVFPATDRSFVFIPRALRPNNQQRLRGKPRSGFGSVGGFSRRTSVYGGGSYYNGSQYSPSVALSRRSSIAPDMGRDFIVSPAGSAISRPPMPPMAMDTARPVVRLPPRVEQHVPAGDGGFSQAAPAVGQSTASELPEPQTHILPQKPVPQEHQSVSIPMYQPRPQKAVSLENIESPTMQQNPQSFQQAFHHQVPVQVSNGLGHDSHARHPSYPRHTTGTPLSQIPERAIHAQPFQPTHYSQPGYYPPYQAIQPQGYYYPSAASYTAAAPAFVPGTQQPQGPVDPSQAGPGSNLVAQEVNGMVYYYDASQIPQVPSYAPSYSSAQGYPASNAVLNMNGLVTPSQDGYYYPQQGAVYYP